MRRDQRGQMMVELGVTIILFMFLTLGIVEFGRILMIVSMVTHATRDAARAAAVEPATNRNAGIIQDWSGIDTLVADQIANVTTVPFTVTHAQPTDNGIPLVEITVTAQNGGIPYLFAPLILPGLGSTSLPVTRTVRFRDEGRS